jgi:hypothetical protein
MRDLGRAMGGSRGWVAYLLITLLLQCVAMVRVGDCSESFHKIFGKRLINNAVYSKNWAGGYEDGYERKWRGGA